MTVVPRRGFQVADAADVARSSDRDRLRLGLARMGWVKALSAAEAHRLIDALADALLFPLAQARMDAPPVQPQPRKTAGRKNKPGGGKPPNLAAHVMAGDVKRALLDLDLPSGRWRSAGKGAADGELNSPMFDVLAMCWEVATKAPGKPGKKLRDMRRMGAGPNAWRPSPARPPTAAERQQLRDEAAAAAVEQQRRGIIT